MAQLQQCWQCAHLPLLLFPNYWTPCLLAKGVSLSVPMLLLIPCAVMPFLLVKGIASNKAHTGSWKPRVSPCRQLEGSSTARCFKLLSLLGKHTLPIANIANTPCCQYASIRRHAAKLTPTLSCTAAVLQVTTCSIGKSCGETKCTSLAGAAGASLAAHI